jgi:hypothetical protein
MGILCGIETSQRRTMVIERFMFKLINGIDKGPELIEKMNQTVPSFDAGVLKYMLNSC